MHRDVPTLRRYISALIETSMPTFVLYTHMNWMGPAQALGETGGSREGLRHVLAG